jgi:hypothetical protein
MIQVLIATLLSVWLFLIGNLSYGLEDSQFLVESWICAFSLPIWSIISIGLWHDVGRTLFGEITSVDSKDSRISIQVRSSLFILWMSFVFTYICWIHINLQVVHLMIMIPLLSIPMNNLLVRNWSTFSPPSVSQITTVLTWGVLSYLTYWSLTILWILFRVFVLDITADGFVYIVQ